MKNYQELLDLKESSKCRTRRQNRAVKEAVQCLIDNGFTGIDIATVMTADEADVCAVIDEEYTRVVSSEGKKICRKIKPITEQEKNMYMNTDRILVKESGYVKAKVTTEMKQSNNYMAIQYLEDGLSYLNYAKLGSFSGTGDPQKDHDVGMSFIMDGLCELADERNIF